MSYAALIKPLDSLCECCRADRSGQDGADVRHPEVAAVFGGSFFVGKHRDQASITRIKIHMAFIRIVQIGLIKNEWHA